MSTLVPTHRRVRVLRLAGVVCVMALLGAAVYVPIAFLTKSRSASMRMQCLNNLIQIGGAIRNYELIKATQCPAYLASKDGTPLLSWRVSLLPFVEAIPPDPFDILQAWDRPANERLSSQVPDIFLCPSDDAGERNKRSSYHAIVADSNVGVKSPPPVIGIIESSSADPWTKPGFIYESEVAMLVRHANTSHLGVYILLPTGEICLLPQDIDPSEVSKVFVRAAGKTWASDYK
jgi:hypothetical protein